MKYFIIIDEQVDFDIKASEDSTLKGGIPRSLKFSISKQLTNYKNDLSWIKYILGQIFSNKTY